ncbi:BAR-domain-containing protein [Patellaria atrata CBS 101060]|uniref:BAR-domain-containing protein n=1 Tax=Patellaria atrata CBS 101060 TaxID=1346257 RepID=A0A9P4SGU5_9PEZI|nr:BAR-domain-containing protein [Patellaria atrata CBS 101060]
MLVNKKLDRFKQWAGERMGGEVKTNTSDNFKALELEMNLRHEGMEKLHNSMNAYVKTMSKRDQVDNKEKMLPIGHLASTMIAHSEDFEPDSEFGICLSSLGRANERIARFQDTYAANATTSWLESTERSLAQMKEYQNARKKLETRRLAYDTSLSKMQKQKKEDFRVEEELRSQKAKYEESSEDVYRRMQDIKEAEVESVQDLTAFLEAELAYHDRCREILMQVKREWPVTSPTEGRRLDRSRSNTAHSFNERLNPPIEEEPLPDPRLQIPKLPSRTSSPRIDRPPNPRASTMDSSRNRDVSPAPLPRLTRVPTEPTSILAGRAGLRPVNRATNDVFDDPSDDSSRINESSSPDRGYYGRERSVSPATSYASSAGRATSWDVGAAQAKKMPPPPPPARKKPAPPPPPMKRSALSSSEVNR